MMQDQGHANSGENVAIPVSKPVVLIGLMGTGKSQIGRNLAKIMGLPFADCDSEFEAAAGSSISDYFARYGEESFRAGEYKVMDRLLDDTPKIVAAGGGAVTHPDTRALLKTRACAVWLVASPAVLAARCAGNARRPLLQDGDPESILAGLAIVREPLYKEVAAFSVDTESGDSIDDILKGLKTWFSQH